VGAGEDERAARQPAVLDAGGFRLGVLGITDHPSDFAAAPDRPGVAYADLHSGVPDWIIDTIQGHEKEAMLVTPHWGPNMTKEPVPHVRAAASALVGAGATFSIAPCIPAMWPAFSIHWTVGRTSYHISVLNPDHRCRGVRAAELDGAPIDPDAIPVLDDGQAHAVVVQLGEPAARGVSSSVSATTGTPTR